MNMDRLTVLLLTLLVGVQAYRYQAVSETAAEHYTAAAGPVFSFPLASLPIAFPATTWSISAWIYPESLTSADAEVLTLKGPTTNTALTGWSNGITVSVFSALISTNKPVFAKWTFVLLGVSSTDYFAAFIRKAGTLYKNTWATGLHAINSNDEILGARTASSFTVSSHAGTIRRCALHSGRTRRCVLRGLYGSRYLYLRRFAKRPGLSYLPPLL